MGKHEEDCGGLICLLLLISIVGLCVIVYQMNQSKKIAVAAVPPPLPAPLVNRCSLNEAQNDSYLNFMQFSDSHIEMRAARGDRPEDGQARLRILGEHRQVADWRTYRPRQSHVCICCSWKSARSAQNDSWSFFPHAPTPYADWSRQEMYELVLGVSFEVDRETTFTYNKLDETVLIPGVGTWHSIRAEKNVTEMNTILQKGRAYRDVWRLPFSAFGYQKGVLRPTSEECSDGKLSLVWIVGVESRDANDEDENEVRHIWRVYPRLTPSAAEKFPMFYKMSPIRVEDGACNMGSQLSAEFTVKMKEYYKRYPLASSPRQRRH